jgi:hypothetical protein
MPYFFLYAIKGRPLKLRMIKKQRKNEKRRGDWKRRG